MNDNNNNSNNVNHHVNSNNNSNNNNKNENNNNTKNNNHVKFVKLKKYEPLCEKCGNNVTSPVKFVKLQKLDEDTLRSLHLSLSPVSRSRVQTPMKGNSMVHTPNGNTPNLTPRVSASSNNTPRKRSPSSSSM